MILKLKRTPGIYVVGFMASGKTTIAHELADELGWNFADLDEDIESQQGITIAEIFDTQGEEEFRRIETAVLTKRIRRIERGQPTVLALGGGTFAQPANFELMEENGVSVWLDCPFEIVCRRVSMASHRPLARDPEQFRRLFDDRRAAYLRSDYRIRIVDDDPMQAVRQIMDLPIF